MKKKKAYVFLGLAIIVVLGVGIGLFVTNGQRQSVTVEPGQQEGMVQESDDMIEDQKIAGDDMAMFIPN